jgi:tRNA pseudouridine32 synthase/23S rRNA pseudouridine746 synthase
MKHVVFKGRVSPRGPFAACDFFTCRTGLSKTRIKDAMNKGAAWLKRKDGKRKRIRRATRQLKAGDSVALYYDESLLERRPPTAECIADHGDYSVWFKPPGLMTQGTNFGDHFALLRHAETYFKPRRRVYPVHRLDREAGGIVLIAHSRVAARKLSSLFQNQRITKSYRVEVLGHPGLRAGRIDLALDGKEAVTDYAVIAHDTQRDVCRVSVQTKTGRRHQIRRHFDLIGHPVIGDPRYGRGNKNAEGLCLRAVSLKFRCPFSRREMFFSLPEHPPVSKPG